MASRVIHYVIANKILQELNMDKKLFLLGNLAPDAHDGTLEGNSCSHFRRIINNAFDKYPNIDLLRFREKYMKNSMGDDFIVGYYCHLVSDDVWVKSIYPKYLKFNLNAEDNKKQRDNLSHDFTSLNNLLLDRYDLHYIKDMTVPKQLSIEEFKYDSLENLLIELNNDLSYRQEDTVLSVLSIEFIFEYIDKSVKRSIEDINFIMSQFTPKP